MVSNSLLILLDFSCTVKAATLIFIAGCCSAILSAKEGKSGFIYNLVKKVNKLFEPRTRACISEYNHTMYVFCRPLNYLKPHR